MLGGLLGAGSGAPSHPFRTRLRAWWEGYELPPPPASANSGQTKKQKQKEPHEPVTPSWTADRIAATQLIFGDGMVGPFDDEMAKKMVDPLGLDEKMSVVELGSGLGGFARWVAKHTGAYVTGFEPETELAKAAMDLSTKAGLAKKARIVHEPADTYDVRARTVDAVVSKVSLYRYPDKAKLIPAIRKSLKPGAQVSFTDYVLKGDPMSPDILVWSANEISPPHLITANEYRAQLEKVDLEVSILEDITDLYVQSVLGAFSNFAKGLVDAAPDDERRALGLNEGEFWNRRLRVMELGVLRVYRIYARLPAIKG